MEIISLKRKLKFHLTFCVLAQKKTILKSQKIFIQITDGLLNTTRVEKVFQLGRIELNIVPSHLENLFYSGCINSDYFYTSIIIPDFYSLYRRFYNKKTFSFCY